MKILVCEAEFIEVKNVASLEYAEPSKDYDENVSLGRSMVCYITGESSDEYSDLSKTNILLCLKETIDQMESEGIEALLLYPWAHGSCDLSSPSKSLKYYKRIKEVLIELSEEKNFKVYSVGFGMKKAHTMKQGQNSFIRYYDLKNELKKRLTENKEQALKEDSRFIVLASDGTEACLDSVDPLTQQVILDEVSVLSPDGRKEYTIVDEPTQLKSYEDSLELAIGKTNSSYFSHNHLGDSGTIVLKPKLVLLSRLITEKLRRYLRRNLRVFEVECPSVLDLDHELIKKYVSKFPASLYQVSGGKKKLALRFAACPHHFFYVKNSYVNEKMLPIRVFEIAKSVYRVQKTGETKGMQRLRSFTMPDMHVFTGDELSNRAEFLNLLQKTKEIMTELDLMQYCVPTFRCTSEYYEQNKGFFDSAVSLLDRNCIFELWETQKYYFQVKFELNSVIGDFISQLSTIQIDSMYPQLYGITYCDGAGKKDLHAMHVSLTGSIERVCDAKIRAGLSKEWMNPLLKLVLPCTPGPKFMNYISRQSLRIPIQIIRRKNAPKWDVLTREEGLLIVLLQKHLDLFEERGEAYAADMQVEVYDSYDGTSTKGIFNMIQALNSEYSIVEGSLQTRGQSLV